MTVGKTPDQRARRVGDSDREAAVEQLRAAAGDGHITLDELDGRVESALLARTLGDLAALTSDLPVPTTLVSAVPAPPASLRLAVSHGHVDRLERWEVPARIDLELVHATAALNLRSPGLPLAGVHIHIQAERGSIRLLVDDGARVDFDNVGRHKSTVADRRPRRLPPWNGVTIHITGDLRRSNLKILRPGRRWF